MVTVYVWVEDLVHRNIGHASLLVTEGLPLGQIYISWWPEKKNNGFLAAAIGVPRRMHSCLEEDMGSKNGEGRPPDSRIRIVGLNETEIKTFWSRWSSSGNYSGLLFNCATTVAEALREGGGDRLVPGWDLPTVCGPRDVRRYATQIGGALAKAQSA